MRLDRAAAGLLVLLAAPPAKAASDSGPEAPLEFVANPSYSIEPGTRTTASLLHLVLAYPAVLPSFGLNEDAPLEAAVAIGGRAGALLFVDFPLTMFANLLNHEVFGHGARAREQGFNPGYVFTLVPPYSWLVGTNLGFLGSTENIARPTIDRSLPFDTGGLEAEVFASYDVNRRIAMANGRLEYSDLLLYFGKLVYYDEFLDLNSSAGGDARAYLDDLRVRFNLWHDGDRAVLARRLRRAWMTTLIDPTLWLAFYHLLVGRVWNGERQFTVPFLEIGDYAFYPGVRFNLSPFGAEHYLDLFIHTKAGTFAPYVRFSSTGLATDVGGGVSVLGWPLSSSPEIALGGELDVWVQPEILLDQRNVFTRRALPGGSLALRADVTVVGRIGVILKLGYKGRGYLMAQPIEPGPYGFAGLRLAL